jgi:hypothetical protein
VELTGLRTPCVLIDRFRPGLKQHMLSSEKTGPAFRCGVMAVVRTGRTRRCGRCCAGGPARPSSSGPPAHIAPRPTNPASRDETRSHSAVADALAGGNESARTR